MAAKDALVSLGFTALESEIYACLVREGSSSGYRVAQTIGKPAANTYKALETLQRKGAVVQDDAKKKTYAPIAPETLLTRLNKEFEKNRASAMKAFKDASVPTPASKLLPVSSLDQAVQLAKNALASASETVVLIASEAVFARLGELPQVEQLLVMTSAPANGLIQVPTEAFDHDTLELVVDHQSTVFFTSNQGFAIENHPLGSTMHQAVVCQIGLYQVDRKLEEEASRKQLARVIENLP
ncbi:MAG: helix-turn-helix domain-containing protein [Armatimonadota bacterium]